MPEKIWDLTPEGGGPPVQVIVGNPNEAIAAHPERYTRKPPDGTAQAELAKVDSDKAAKRAAIEKEKNEKLGSIAKARDEKLAALEKERQEAKKAALEKQRAEDEKIAKEKGDVPVQDAKIAAIEAEAHAAAELAEHEAAQKRKELDASA